MRGDHFSESAWADGRGVEVSISWLLLMNVLGVEGQVRNRK